MNKPTWIVFDVGGVLFDFPRAFAAIEKYLNVESTYVKKIIDTLIGNEERGGVTLERVYTEVLRPIDKMSELDHVIDMWYSQEFWLPKTISLMAELKSAGYHIAIMTNNWANMTERLLGVPGVNVTEKLYESSVIGMRKPDLEFYNYIQNDLKVKPEELFLIDDLPENIEGAKVAGWQTFTYTIGDDNGKHANETLRDQLLS
jgi:HAD superfamily hydrolase (TIGR01509 family)